MTTYRSPPLHHLSRKRKPKRIALSRRVKFWYEAMIDPNPYKSTQRSLFWIEFKLRWMSRELRGSFDKLRRAIEEFGSTKP